jgi:hypothetical protein
MSTSTRQVVERRPRLLDEVPKADRVVPGRRQVLGRALTVVGVAAGPVEHDHPRPRGVRRRVEARAQHVLAEGLRLRRQVDEPLEPRDALAAVELQPGAARGQLAGLGGRERVRSGRGDGAVDDRCEDLAAAFIADHLVATEVGAHAVERRDPLIAGYR